jgi:hypothetical protein
MARMASPKVAGAPSDKAAIAADSFSRSPAPDRGRQAEVVLISSGVQCGCRVLEAKHSNRENAAEQERGHQVASGVGEGPDTENQWPGQIFVPEFRQDAVSARCRNDSYNALLRLSLSAAYSTP